MVQLKEEKAIGLRLKPDEWELISQARAKTGTTYRLFLKSVRWLDVITPDQFVSTSKGNRRDTVVWVKKEDYQKVKEKAQQLKVSMGSLIREIMLKEARELLQGGQDEKQHETSERTG